MQETVILKGNNVN